MSRLVSHGRFLLGRILAFGIHSSMISTNMFFQASQLLSRSEWLSRTVQLVASIISHALSQSVKLYLHTVLALDFIVEIGLRQRRVNSLRWSELESAVLNRRVPL